MKGILYKYNLHGFFCFLILLFSAINGFAQKGVNVGFSKIEGFEIKSGMEPVSGMYAQTYSRKAQFDDVFVVKKAPGIKPGKLDFNRFMVISFSTSKSTTETIYKLEKIRKNQGVLEVYFVSSTQNKQMKLAKAAYCLYSTAKDESLKGMIYYLNGKVFQDVQN